MREILFRGKTKQSEWVYGNYCGAEYLEGDGIEHLIIEISRNGNSVHIIPETVGQYIGRKDKNEKFIFEGDILSGAWKTLLLVYYDEASTSFLVKDSKGHSHPIDYYDNNRLKVVGNIYDNPELMKGGMQ